MPHIITFANEKGGTGKSTSAVHVALYLLNSGKSVAAVDLDHRQKTFARYIENRRARSETLGAGLALPDTKVLGGDANANAALEQVMSRDVDYVIIDTPGRDSELARTAIAHADTLVTPINDSFVDFDLIGQVDPDTYAVKRPSFYAELVWQARKDRARRDRGSIDWVVLRNRMSQLVARNMQRVGEALDQLAPRIGFRVAPGLSERVIYRELFPQGLTLLDLSEIEAASMSHVAARAELRALVDALDLPDENEERAAA